MVTKTVTPSAAISSISRQKQAPRDRVDAARGLVEEDDAGPVHHGAGQRQPLLPAARQLAGQPVLLALEARHVDGPGLALAGLGTAQAVDPAEEAEVLPDGEVVVEAEALAHVADAALDALRVLRDVDTEDEPRARGRREQAAQHADGRGLAGAVRAEEAEDLALGHRERHAVDRGEGAEALGELAELDGCRHRPTARSRPAAARRSTASASVRARAARSWASSASRSSEEGMTPSR